MVMLMQKIKVNYHLDIFCLGPAASEKQMAERDFLIVAQ